MGEHRQEEEIPLTPAMIATLGDGPGTNGSDSGGRHRGRGGDLFLPGNHHEQPDIVDQLGLLLAATAYAALIVVLYKGRKVRLDRESGRYLRLAGWTHGADSGGDKGPYHLVAADVGRYRTSSD